MFCSSNFKIKKHGRNIKHARHTCHALDNIGNGGHLYGMGGPEKYAKQGHGIGCFAALSLQMRKFQGMIKKQKPKDRGQIMNNKIDQMITENPGSAKKIIDGKGKDKK